MKVPAEGSKNNQKVYKMHEPMQDIFEKIIEKANFCYFLVEILDFPLYQWSPLLAAHMLRNTEL